MRAFCILLGTSLIALGACQDYPFEMREAQRVDAKKINEVVATLNPVDILFIVDNSLTMEDEQEELQNNVELFVTELAASSVDFHVGIITPDVECNLPVRDCGSGGSTSIACCNFNPPMCTDTTNGDGNYVHTTCDGGRLRGVPGRRFFTRPSDAERTQWIADFRNTIAGLGLQGSSFESGLEAAIRAVECSLGNGCVDPRIAELNAGFIRPEADLVLIFLTDEDDCSFRDASRYARPPDPYNSADQLEHLCSPNECYAHYGADLDVDVDGMMDWSDPSSGSRNYFMCQDPSTFAFTNRLSAPPLPDSTTMYLNRLIDLKGSDVARVRAAGIISGVSDPDEELGFSGSGCRATISGPTASCECLTGSPNQLFCEVAELGRPSDVVPAVNECEAMPTSRYVDFLVTLADRRQAAALQTDVLLDSICQSQYTDTLYNIVNNVILSSCFELGQAVPAPDQVAVQLNGEALPNVEPGSALPGWSLVPNSQEICLEGGLSKNIDDQFEIFVLGE